MIENEPVGLRLIICYKIVKAALQAAAAVFLLYGAAHGLAASLTSLAEQLKKHAVHAGSSFLVGVLARFGEGRDRLRWVAYALAGDAVLSSVEAWALATGRRWGSWLVVGATASLIPFEVVALLRHPHLGRASILVLNLGIAAYLARRSAGHVTGGHGNSRVPIDEGRVIR